MNLNPNMYNPEVILSGSELFKYRKVSDKSLPNVGGYKDFAPDGTWLQDKKTEKFYEERLELLAEQRVERIGNLVTGNWNPEKQLVELHKELGKFWVYMGFVDKSRKWLLPEEALYLMETNTMEVQYKGLPLSIQQAYKCFLNSTITLEQYQVYSHLRRLGYVIVRHQGRLDVTEYERKLKLDQHRKSKKSRTKKRKPVTEQDLTSCKVKKTEGNCSTEDMDIFDPLDRDKSSGDKSERTDQEIVDVMDIERDFSSEEKDDKQLVQEVFTAEKSDGKQLVLNQKHEHKLESLQNRNEQDKVYLENIDELDCEDASDEYVSYKMKHRKRTSDSDIVVNFSQPFVSLKGNIKNIQAPIWNFSEIHFPDIGRERVLHISNSDKNLELFPPGVQLPENFTFDVEKYWQKLSFINKKKRNNEEDVLELDYSFPACNSKSIRARNWKEYKEKLTILQGNGKKDWMLSSPVSYLWTGDVKPLVKPCDAVNIGRVLEKLQVIKSKDQPRSLSTLSPQHRVIFDVYLPDCKFKKSSPGFPHHRLCIIRHSEPLPDVQTLTYLHHYYTDGIPLHWAVVDSGDIAFYDFTHIDIPVIL